MFPSQCFSFLRPLTNQPPSKGVPYLFQEPNAHTFIAPSLPNPPKTQKEEIFRNFKLKITIDQTIDTIRVCNIYGVNILGKYKQREEQQISEIGYKAEKIRTSLEVSV
jgi:hypothetical protein